MRDWADDYYNYLRTLWNVPRDIGVEMLRKWIEALIEEALQEAKRRK